MFALASELPVARVIGTQPVDVNGVTAPASNFVPVSIGSDVSIKSGVAILQFVDGTSVTLQPNSQLRIEGQFSSPTVRIVRGAAEYKMSLASHVRVSTGSSQTVNTLPDRDRPGGNTIASGNSSFVETAMNRGPNSQIGAALPSKATLGSFAFAPDLGHAVFRASGPSSGPGLVTPTGLVINLTPVRGPGGEIINYTVTSFSETVTQPSGQTAIITVTSGSLVGSTVTGIPHRPASGIIVNVQYTLPGQSKPLGPDQVSVSVQQALNGALNTAIQNGSVQPGTMLGPVHVAPTTYSNPAP